MVEVSWTSSCPQTLWLKMHRMHVLKYIWAQTSSVQSALNPSTPVSPQLCLTAPLLCRAGMVKALCGLKYTFTHHRGLFPVGWVNKWLWLRGTPSGWIDSAHSVIKRAHDQYGAGVTHFPIQDLPGFCPISTTGLLSPFPNYIILSTQTSFSQSPLLKLHHNLGPSHPGMAYGRSARLLRADFPL